LEFFSFYDVSSKFAGIIGPFVFGIVGQITGSSRLSVVALVIFFVGGGIILRCLEKDPSKRYKSVGGPRDGPRRPVARGALERGTPPFYPCFRFGQRMKGPELVLIPGFRRFVFPERTEREPLPATP
jgi:hypothetical protein